MDGFCGVPKKLKKIQAVWIQVDSSQVGKSNDPRKVHPFQGPNGLVATIGRMVGNPESMDPPCRPATLFGRNWTSRDDHHLDSPSDSSIWQKMIRQKSSTATPTQDAIGLRLSRIPNKKPSNLTTRRLHPVCWGVLIQINQSHEKKNGLTFHEILVV